MPCRQMSVLCNLEEDYQDPTEDLSLEEVELFWVEEEHPVSPSSSSSSSSSPSVLCLDNQEEVSAAEVPDQVIMPYCQMSDLCTLEEDHQDPTEDLSLEEVELFWVEEEHPVSPSSSSSSSSSSPPMLLIDLQEEEYDAETPSQLTIPQHQIVYLRNLEEDHQDPTEDLSLEEIQLLWGEEELPVPPSSPSPASPSPASPSVLSLDIQEDYFAAETPSPPQSPQGACPSPHAVAAIPWSQSDDEGSSTQDEEGPSTWEVPEDAESLLQKVLSLKKREMVEFLLLKCRAKELITEAEMLSSVIKEYQDHFPEIFSHARQCVHILFGIDVKEVDPKDHSYMLVPSLGLTYDGMVSDEQRFPNTGLLVAVLWVIAVEGDCASEEEVWKALGVMGVRDGEEHWIYGEPRELITKVWVEEQYLVYRQVPNSDPARHEFLWGPRAYAETTKSKALKFGLRVNARVPGSFPSLSDEAESDDEEEA